MYCVGKFYSIEVWLKPLVITPYPCSEEQGKLTLYEISSYWLYSEM